MRLFNVQLKRTEHEERSLDLPAWEIPVLQVVHGTDKITVGAVTIVDREYPDAETEYDRLTRRYGEHKESGDSYLSKVYGTLAENLGAAIDREIVAEGKAIEQAEQAAETQAVAERAKEDELRAKIRAEILAEQTPKGDAPAKPLGLTRARGAVEAEPLTQ